MPDFVSGRTGLRQRLVDTDTLQAVILVEFPGQVIAGDKMAQPGMKRRDVIILKVDLNKGLPVVIALMDFDVVKDIVRELKLRTFEKMP